jgi:acetate kinase
MYSTAKNILVLNAGSSSTKISLYRFDTEDEQSKSGTEPQHSVWQVEADFPDGSFASIDWQSLLASQTTPISAVGHRVVHGGSKYSSSVIINDDVKQDIKDCIKLAPLHNKIALAQIEAMEKLLPKGTKQIAVFDTAFHRTLAESTSFYPLPYAWREKYGIHRYGFHGINYQYCTQQAAKILKKEISELSLIICHLGGGCSLAAIEAGKSVNTTMGFTPMEGLMMRSRCGSIDPGIILYLLKNENMTVDQIDEDLNKSSGLKGISQLDGDMKTIIEKMQATGGDESRLAKLAFDMFVERLRSHICSMRSSLKKLDALVFTAGIGEHAPLVRQLTCANLDFLGIEIDEQINQKSGTDKNIASAKSQAAVLVIKAREDWQIARQCLLLTDNY